MYHFLHLLPSIACTILFLPNAFAQGNPDAVSPKDATHETLAYYLLLIQAPEQLDAESSAVGRFKMLEKQQVAPAGGWNAGQIVSRPDVVTTLHALLYSEKRGGETTIEERGAVLEKQGVNPSRISQALARTAVLLGRTEETRSVLNRINLKDPVLLTRETFVGVFYEKGEKKGFWFKKDGIIAPSEGKARQEVRWELHVEDRAITWKVPGEEDSGLGLFIINQNMLGFAYDTISKTFYREGTPTEESSAETLKAMLGYLPPAWDVGGEATASLKQKMQRLDRTDPRAVAETFWEAVLAHQWEVAASFVKKEDRKRFLEAAPRQIPGVPNPPKQPVIGVKIDGGLVRTKITNWKEWDAWLDMVQRRGTWWIEN